MPDDALIVALKRKISGACSSIVAGWKMEHRCGQRHPIDVGVYIRAASGERFSKGTLSDVSISGGFIRTSLLAEPLSSLVIQFAADDGESRAMAAQVVRRTPKGLGVEWMEYATELVQTLTRSATSISSTGPLMAAS
jgi:hypothetical protein